VSEVLWAFTQLDLRSIIDIALVAMIFYGVFFAFRGTAAIQLLRGIIVVIVLAILLTNLLRLTAFSWLVRNSITALLVAIPVLFQPELRRGLERLGRTGGWFGRFSRETMRDQVIREICRAVDVLSENRYGAIIVLERETGLQDYIETGIIVDATVSAELLITLFFPNTALHDGAAIIREDRIVAAACVLPLTSEVDDRNLGTRHRAAIGVTETSDAVSIVVSEETGIISLARNGRIIRRLDPARLANILRALYHPPFGDILPRWVQPIWQERQRRRS